MTGLVGATAFLTAFGRGAPPSASSMAWFPVVGAAVGALLAGLWIGAEKVWPVGVAAAIVVVADLVVTGMLHVDGLIDSADGLLPHLPTERRLEVMAQPDVGAFGVAVFGGVVLLRWASLAAITADARVLVALWCASRSLMALVATCGRYARPEGLATAFAAGRPRATVASAVAGVVAATAVAMWWDVGLGVVALASALVGGAAVVALSYRRIGGFTGDVLGAAGVVAETVGLVAAASL